MPKPKLTSIENERVRLRPLRVDDLPLTLAWRNQDSIRVCFFQSDIISPQQHRKWFEAYLKRDDDIMLIIEEKLTLQRAVGQISLYHIDRERQRAELGRLMIGDWEARGKGIAKDAVRLLVQFAENQLGLREIRLDVFANNLPALAVYRSCGFVRVGVHAPVVHMVWMKGAPEAPVRQSMADSRPVRI